MALQGATAVTYPLDIMRTQFAVQGRVKTYSSMRAFVRTTIATKGVSGTPRRYLL